MYLCDCGTDFFGFVFIQARYHMAILVTEHNNLKPYNCFKMTRNYKIHHNYDREF